MTIHYTSGILPLTKSILQTATIWLDSDKKMVIHLKSEAHNWTEQSTQVSPSSITYNDNLTGCRNLDH